MMDFLGNWMKQFLADEEGASAVEYGLIAALIAVAIVSVLLLISPQLVGVFEDVESGLSDATSSGGGT